MSNVIMRDFGKRSLVVLWLFGVMLCMPVQAAQSKKIRDWTVECDDNRTCTMRYDSDDHTGLNSIKFQRGGEPNTLFTLSLPMQDNREDASKAQYIFTIDDSEVAQISASQMKSSDGDEYTSDNTAKIAKLLSAMKQGQSMGVTYRGPEASYDLSVPLSGVTGVLLFIDEAQGRLQGGDALQAKATQSVSPQSVSAGVSSESITDLSQLPSSVRVDFEAQGAVCYLDPDYLKDGTGFSLRYDQDLRLIVMPCGSVAAYNQPYVIYGGYGDALSRLSFPMMAKDGPTITTTAGNISYDEAKGELTSFQKARGLGDCGTYSVWRIETKGGDNFLHLVQMRNKEECDGDDMGGFENWPLVWPQKQ